MSEKIIDKSPQFLINPLSLYEHIKIKQKIKHLDCHDYLPWILLADKNNTIIIYDINKKHIIRAFSLSQYFSETIVIKSLKFLDLADHDYIKAYIDEYENNSSKKNKGIPINLRSSLIYLVSDKYIFFYSYLLQNFIRYISNKELNNYNFVSAELYDFSKMLILADDGNIYKWNLQTWTSSKIEFSKDELPKGISMMKVIQLNTGEKIVIICTKNRQLYKFNLNLKENNLTRIDKASKSQHSKDVIDIKFSPFTNILMTMSKADIIIYNIRSTEKFKKIPLFQLEKKEYISGLLPNLSMYFDNSYYFCFSKKCHTIFLLDLNRVGKSSDDFKNFVNTSIFNLDLEKDIFSKVNDKEIRIYALAILQHLYEYLIIGTNKGLIIYKFDTSNRANLISLNTTPLLYEKNIQNYYFYYFAKDCLLYELKIMLSHDKKKNLNVKKTMDHLKTAIINKAPPIFNMYDIQLNFKNNLITFLNKLEKTYIIFEIVFSDKSPYYNMIYKFKEISHGTACDFKWSAYSNNFAITKQNIKSCSFNLEVYSISDEKKVKLIYDVKGLYTHKIFGGHFIGAIVEKNGEHLQVPMKYIHNYNYNYALKKDSELNFYYWEENNKLKLTIKEEPVDIISSEDLQFMIICFKDKYNVYKLNEYTGNLEKINTVYDTVVNGYIYENIIFIYLTEYGTYFLILNKESPFPCKLFRQSDSVNLYNLKIARKFKENIIIYDKKPKQVKILGINDNLFFTTDNIGTIEVTELNHIIFKIISLIKKKNISGINTLLSFLDKNLIKDVLLIFEYFYENDEKILREIFTPEMIQNFELYNYFDFFIKDLKEKNPAKLEAVLEKELIKALIKNDRDKVNKLYETAKKYELKMETKVARCINRTMYLDSLMSKKRYFESYLFNLTNQVNKSQNNENILSMAIEQAVKNDN